MAVTCSTLTSCNEVWEFFCRESTLERDTGQVAGGGRITPSSLPDSGKGRLFMHSPKRENEIKKRK